LFTYLILLETVLDVSIANIRTTLLLLSMHFVFVTCSIVVKGVAEKLM